MYIYIYIYIYVSVCVCIHLFVPISKKSTIAFACFLTLHLFFGIIYLTLFVLLLHTCPFEKLENIFIIFI